MLCGAVKEAGLGRKELDFDAEAVKASANTVGSCGAGGTLQRCPTLRPGGPASYPTSTCHWMHAIPPPQGRAWPWSMQLSPAAFPPEGNSAGTVL